MTEHFYTSFHNVLESHAFAFPSVPVSCFQSLHPRLLNFSLHFPHVSHCLLISHIISSTVLLQRLYHYYVHVICSPGLYCATQFFLSYFHHCPFTIYHHFCQFLSALISTINFSLPFSCPSIYSTGSDGRHVLRWLCDTFSKQYKFSWRRPLLKKHRAIWHQIKLNNTRQSLGCLSKSMEHEHLDATALNKMQWLIVHNFLLDW